MPIDYKDYPPNWKNEIVPRIIERAGNCCEICHIANGAKVYSVEVLIQGGRGISWRRVWLTSWSDVVRFRAFTNDMKEVKVILTVAHLDHDEMNHNVSDDRLKALCQYCHLLYDSEEKSRRRKEENAQLELQL